MSAFQPGQTVTGDYMGRAVTGTVVRVRPSIVDRQITVLDLDVQGEEVSVLARDAQLTTAPDAQEVSMTASDTSATPKKGRSSKAVAVTPEPATAPVGFKAAAAATREKLQNRSRGKGKAAADPEATAPELVPEVEAPAAAPSVEPALPPTPILADSLITSAPLNLLVPSPLNPRKEFDPAAVAELAESIAHKGLMQNLVGRSAQDGGTEIEIVAGGRRLKALQLLNAQGRVPADHPVAVRIRSLTDLEALQLATAENVERRSMTPLEEADAFAQMVALGADPKDIALRFGYNDRTVQQRLVLAEGLGEDGRALYAEGHLSLRGAQIIAQTTGPLRKHVLAEAKRGGSVANLEGLIKQQSFLVERAHFDVAASGLEVIEDLFGSQPARFADPKAAMAMQLDWVKAREEQLTGQSGQHFVEVRKTDSTYLSLPYSDFTTSSSRNILGTVIMVSTATGEIKEVRAARHADIKSEEAKQRAAERKAASSEAAGSEGGAIRKSGWVDGHEARATALRSALVGDHKRTVALTILSMLGGPSVSLRTTFQDVQTAPIPTGMERLKALDAQLGGALKANPQPAVKNPLGIHFSYGDSGVQEYELLEKLLTLTLEQLLTIQGVLVTQAVGGWSDYNPIHPPKGLAVRLAADTGAVVTFRLTDAHLKAYPRNRLIELAEDAGIAEGYGVGGGHISKLQTNTEIRQGILQHAGALEERGYVPAIARFPGADGLGVQDASDRAYLAQVKDLVSRLSDAQLSELMEDLGIDPTAEMSDSSPLGTVLSAVNDMDVAELREWPEFQRIAKDVGPANAEAAAPDAD